MSSDVGGSGGVWPEVGDGSIVEVGIMDEVMKSLIKNGI